MTKKPSRTQLIRILMVAALAVVVTASECPMDDNTPGGGNGGTTPTATSMVAVSGGGQTGTVGGLLAENIVVQVNDQSGNAMSGVTVSFAVTEGGGTLNPETAATGSDGRVSTSWTLGTTVGSQEMSASVSGISSATLFSATAVADVAVAIELESGNGQTGLLNASLSNPIVVQVVDEHGNGVVDETVEFEVLTGGGSITSPAATDADGFAQATWTLGPAEGTNTAQASADGLTGGPIDLTATATTLTISTVSPSPLVEGGSATVTGTGFDLTPGNNTVTVDGAPAAVTDVANTTSLTITVPTFNCRPERDVDIVVSVAGTDATATGHSLQPMEAQLGLAVGEQVIIEDPADFCLQFAASTGGGDAYLIGVGSVAEIPGGTMPFRLANVSAASGAPLAATLPRPSRAAAAVPVTVDAAYQALREKQAIKEAEIRSYEQEYLDPNNTPGLTFLSGSPMVRAGAAAPPCAPAVDVGDQREFRVPGTGCQSNDFQVVTATAREIGEYGIWYTDDDNPTNDSLTLEDISSASETFDTLIYPLVTDFFDVPSDIDENEKIIVLLTKEVNETGAAGFVHGGDLVSRESCTFSDSGEIFYGYVPDPAGDFGTSHSRQSVLDFLPVLIAHEFTHNIQISRRRVILGGTTSGASWVLEGQATLAEEVVGHAATAHSAGNNYGAAVASLGPPYWYWQGITKLGYYFGYGGFGMPEVETAPEDCTLFGNFVEDIGACNRSAFYGASWSLLRYLTDRFYSGNPSAFHKSLINDNPNLQGIANVEAVTGMDFDSLFAQWGAMLYVDDWVTEASEDLFMQSWDLPEVTAAVSSDAILDPVEQPFADFSESMTVRGGTHAYVIVSAAGPRPAGAIRVRDLTDNPLGPSMLPILWVVRIQ